MVAKKAAKKKARKYDDKPAIRGNFGDVIKGSVAGDPAPKPKENIKDKKKVKKKSAPNDPYNYQEDERELGGEG